jgi:hypothetical protein
MLLWKIDNDFEKKKRSTQKSRISECEISSSVRCGSHSKRDSRSHTYLVETGTPQ